MKPSQHAIAKHLVIEELELRNLMAADVFGFVSVAPIAMSATGLSTNSVEDFYSSVVGTEAGGAAGTGMFDNGAFNTDLFRGHVFANPMHFGARSAPAVLDFPMHGRRHDHGVRHAGPLRIVVIGVP